MAALQPRQRAFVLAWLASPMKSSRVAAEEAGYVGGYMTLNATGYRLANDERILAAVAEMTDKRLRSGGMLGVSVMIEIASNPLHKDQLKAATALADRTGFHAKTEHTVKVKDESRTDDELVRRAKELGAKYGLDTGKLLAGAGIVDADYVDVTPVVKIGDTGESDDEFTVRDGDV